MRKGNKDNSDDSSDDDDDAELVEEGNEHKLSAPDDMGSIVYDGISSIPWFTIFIAIILYILLNTSIFNTHVLRNINPNFEDSMGNKTDSGIIVTGILMGVLLGLMEAMHGAGWI